MNSLRFLLVHRNPRQSEEITALLTRANHSVLSTPGLEEAADALTVERFDAVLMDLAFESQNVEEFSAQLRQIEQAQKSSTHVPIIALAHGNAPELDIGLDAVLPEPLDPDALTAAVTRLAKAVGRAAGDEDNGVAGLEVIDHEKFREQVGFDNELMVEIIDLFLEERKRQEPEIREALMAGKFDSLSRLAHTIKGSLSSLHAQRARAHAEELELAARQKQEDICWSSLTALTSDLAELEPELLALRHVSV